MRLHTSIVIALLAGCGLDGKGHKTACNAPTDCLDGYACMDNVCVRSSDGGVSIVDTSGSADEYGDVQALAPATGGVTAFSDYHTLAGVTTAAGGLGCTMLANESAAPGSDIAIAYAKIDKGESGGDTRCPNGAFPIMNDASWCTSDPISGLRAGCAIYRRWDAAGTQVASRRAIGGYATIKDTFVSESDHRCDVDISMRFGNGVTIARTFGFHFNPLAPAEAFCVPQ